MNGNDLFNAISQRIKEKRTELKKVTGIEHSFLKAEIQGLLYKQISMIEEGKSFSTVPRIVHKKDNLNKSIDLNKAPNKKGDNKELVKLMKKMRKKGSTYKEIATFLNDEKIPTFTNNGKWHAQTIHRLAGDKKNKL